MNSTLKTIICASAIVLATLGQSHAGPVTGQGTWENTLQSRDLDHDGIVDAFYDTQLNITWLRKIEVSGKSQAQAVDWIGQLTFAGYDDWRLPEINRGTLGSCPIWPDPTSGSDCGYNVLTKIGDTVYSEIAHLYYVTLGNKAACAPGEYPCFTYPLGPGEGLTNTALFIDLIRDPWYVISVPKDGKLWNFGMYSGYQTDWFGTARGDLAVMAVRDGDVASAIPEPSTWMLFILAGIMLIRRLGSHPVSTTPPFRRE